jgi:ACR3 family arsenite transporter
VNVTIGQIAESVFIYLGIPFSPASSPVFTLIKVKGKTWYQKNSSPRSAPSPSSPCSLPSSSCFPSRGNISSAALDVLRIAVPLTIYFVFMFFISFYMSAKVGATYPIRHAVFYRRQQQL